MKTLKQYVENYIEAINESILDDEDVLLDPKRDKVIINSWIEDNYTIRGRLKINDDFTVNCSGNVAVKNTNIESLTNGMFRWGNVGGDFYCVGCVNLTSLNGAPVKVCKGFYCTGCNNLTSLEGVPKEVGSDFNCSDCKNLRSLKGAPKKVGSSFYCSRCDNIRSLEGTPKVVGGCFGCSGCENLTNLECAPEKVGENFYCNYCKNLTSLEGAPEEVGWNFVCSNCENLKSLNGVSNPGLKLCCTDCPKLKITDSDYKKYDIES